MTLGDIVHAYRKAHKMTMQEFADRALLSKGYISILEKGVNPRNGQPITPSIETFVHLARVMGMTTSELQAKLADETPVDVPYDPVSALLDAHDIRTVARNHVKGATPEQVEKMRNKLKKMMDVMFGEE